MLTGKTAYYNYFRCILAFYALFTTVFIFEDVMNFSISINSFNLNICLLWNYMVRNKKQSVENVHS